MRVGLGGRPARRQQGVHLGRAETQLALAEFGQFAGGAHRAEATAARSGWPAPGPIVPASVRASSAAVRRPAGREAVPVVDTIRPRGTSAAASALTSSPATSLRPRSAWASVASALGRDAPRAGGKAPSRPSGRRESAAAKHLGQRTTLGQLPHLLAPAGLRQDGGVDAADPPVARGLCAGLGLGRRRRSAAALSGLPDGRAGALRPALARRARGAGDAGPGRTRAGRRGRRAGQRAGRGRAAARPDRHRRHAPLQRPAGLRAAAEDAGTLARTMGPGAGQPGRAAAAAGAAARRRRAGRIRPAPVAFQPGRGGGACAPRAACRPSPSTRARCCSAPMAGRRACA